MNHSPRVEKQLLLLACFLVFNGAVPPLARLMILDHALSGAPTLAVKQSDSANVTASLQPNSCQLNGKGLSTASLLSFAQLLLGTVFLLLLWSPFAPIHWPTLHRKALFCPKRRRHLTFCIWRE